MKSFYFDFIGIPRSRLWVRGILLIAGLAAIAGVFGFERTVLKPQLDAQRQLIASQREKMGSKPIA